MRMLSPTLALVLIGLSPLLVQAQDNPPIASDADSPLIGKVVDAQTRGPIAAAWIKMSGDEVGTYSRADGRFSLPDVPVGEVWIVVEQIGYGTDTVTVAAGERTGVELALDPIPVELEGLRVMVDRFQRRRNAVAMSVQVLEGDDLVFFGGHSALELVRSRGGIALRNCGFMNELNCVLSRGRTVAVSVWVDEVHQSGLSVLAEYEPRELDLIEVYSMGRMVRVYTHRFMKNVAKHPITPVRIR